MTAIRGFLHFCQSEGLRTTGSTISALRISMYDVLEYEGIRATDIASLGDYEGEFGRDGEWYFSLHSLEDFLMKEGVAGKLLTYASKALAEGDPDDTEPGPVNAVTMPRSIQVSPDLVAALEQSWAELEARMTALQAAHEQHAILMSCLHLRRSH
jgi:hypothetical protein